MKKDSIGFILIIATLVSCVAKTNTDVSKPYLNPIIGTWQLITGTVIE